MKALLVLVLLSITISANASGFYGKDLQCRSTDSDGAIVTTLNITGIYGEVKVSYEDTYSTTRLYIKTSEKNMISEIVHSGLAERQTNIDVFEQSNFTLIVPTLLSNGVTLVLNDRVTGQETDRVRFNCVKPDNR